MAVISGGNLKLNVNTGTAATPTWTPVNDMDTLGRRSNRDTNTRPVFMRNVPHQTQGARTETYAIAGLYSPGDPGQDALRKHEEDGTIAHIQVLPNGTGGWSQHVLVNSYTHDAEADPSSLQEFGFEFTATDAKVTI